MTPVMTRTEGDCCLSAALASLLDLPLEDVPVLRVGDLKQQVAAVRSWLRPRGLTLLVFPHAPPADLAAVLAVHRELHPDLHFILLGGCDDTPENHTVICHNGEIVHDPSPRKWGVPRPDAVSGAYWSLFIGKAT